MNNIIMNNIIMNNIIMINVIMNNIILSPSWKKIIAQKIPQDFNYK